MSVLLLVGSRPLRPHAAQHPRPRSRDRAAGSRWIRDRSQPSRPRRPAIAANTGAMRSSACGDARNSRRGLHLDDTVRRTDGRDHALARPETPATRSSMAPTGTVSPGYFPTMGIPLLAGRDFTARGVRPRDGRASGVVILSRPLASSCSRTAARSARGCSLSSSRRGRARSDRHRRGRPRPCRSPPSPSRSLYEPAGQRWPVDLGKHRHVRSALPPARRAAADPPGRRKRIDPAFAPPRIETFDTHRSIVRSRSSGCSRA